jgi:hypothetical protein
LKTERVPDPYGDSDYVDPKHKFQDEPKELTEMQQKFQSRLEFFQDFYKSVSNFKGFDPEAQYQ